MLCQAALMREFDEIIERGRLERYLVDAINDVIVINFQSLSVLLGHASHAPKTCPFPVESAAFLISDLQYWEY